MTDSTLLILTVGLWVIEGGTSTLALTGGVRP